MKSVDDTLRPLKVFLCHAHPDAEKVRALYARLKADGVDAWLDKENIIPGQDWELEIRKAVRESDIVVVCLSKQFSQKGYRQKEVRIALDEASLQPEGEIFIIPARLEECDYPESLKRFHGVDLFEERGYEYLMRALRLRADKIGAVLQAEKTGWGGLKLPTKKPDTQKPKPVVKPQPTPKTEEPEPVARQKFLQKMKTYMITIVVGFIVLFASIFGLLRNQWFTTTPDIATVTPTNAITFTPSQPTITLAPPSLTFTPALATATKTPTLVPTATLSLTEITDSKGVQMVLVQAGEFVMGNNDGDSDEQPVHTAYLDAFYIDKYEVTNGLYKKCADEGICREPDKNWSSSYEHSTFYGKQEYNEYPVLYISWSMANTFCQWRDTRLPNDGEWEKAARGTDGRTYPWGESIDCQYATYQGCTGDVQPVGSYEMGVSSYGAFDLAGNVWEWVSEYSDEYFNSNEYTYNNSDYQIIRGGSWNSVDTSLRTTNRDQLGAHIVTDGIGFRCARDANP